MTAFSEHGQYAVDILDFPTVVVADAAGPLIFSDTEAKQTGFGMLAVYRNRLAFTDNFHSLPLQPATFGKGDDAHPTDDQVVRQANINKGEYGFQARRNLAVDITGFGMP